MVPFLFYLSKFHMYFVNSHSCVALLFILVYVVNDEGVYGGGVKNLRAPTPGNGI